MMMLYTVLAPAMNRYRKGKLDSVVIVNVMEADTFFLILYVLRTL